MRIAICEDHPGDFEHLSELLLEYFATNRMEADIDVFESGEMLLKALTPGKYQIIFQDIYMDKNGLSGIETAERVRETDKEVSIIFTTSSTYHAHLSYEVDAAYYLIKPVNRDALEKALNKCRKKLESFAASIELAVDRQIQKVHLRDIYFAEVVRHYTLFRTASGELKTRMTYEELAEALGAFPFITCHRSFVVNLAHVAEMQDRDFIMKNGALVPISKTYQEEVQKAFKSYFWGE